MLASQQAALETITPGGHWNQSHDATVTVITQGLLDLGIAGELAELIETEAYRPFYMHRAGHWLGMDAHDVGDYKVHDEWRVLESGMVMTVEPVFILLPTINRWPLSGEVLVYVLKMMWL